MIEMYFLFFTFILSIYGMETWAYVVATTLEKKRISVFYGSLFSVFCLYVSHFLYFMTCLLYPIFFVSFFLSYFYIFLLFLFHFFISIFLFSFFFFLSFHIFYLFYQYSSICCLQPHYCYLFNIVHVYVYVSLGFG